ncbi:unnamed protein product, partial [Mesorhabditis spiculigera]
MLQLGWLLLFFIQASSQEDVPKFARGAIYHVVDVGETFAERRDACPRGLFAVHEERDFFSAAQLVTGDPNNCGGGVCKKNIFLGIETNGTTWKNHDPMISRPLGLNPQSVGECTRIVYFGESSMAAENYWYYDHHCDDSTVVLCKARGPDVVARKMFYDADRVSPYLWLALIITASMSIGMLAVVILLYIDVKKRQLGLFYQISSKIVGLSRTVDMMGLPQEMLVKFTKAISTTPQIVQADRELRNRLLEEEAFSDSPLYGLPLDPGLKWKLEKTGEAHVADSRPSDDNLLPQRVPSPPVKSEQTPASIKIDSAILVPSPARAQPSGEAAEAIEDEGTKPSTPKKGHDGKT